MNVIYHFEQACVRLRHSTWFERAAPLWNALRPAYDHVMRIVGRKGLERRINGTDTLRVIPELRGVWALLMQGVGSGSKVIDVGAHVGLYAVAIGNRVRPGGKVLAAEPDPANVVFLRRQVVLNGLQEIVTVLPVAFSDQSGEACLSTKGIESRVTPSTSWGTGTTNVTLKTLDEATWGEGWDILLIDVEGFEEKVLRGGRALLSDPLRRPRTVLVEVHPYVWAEPGTTSDSLLHELRQHGYVVNFLDGTEVKSIKDYGHIVATIPTP